MATYASQPRWELRARAISGARLAVPLGLGALLAISFVLRTQQIGIGFWIDEGLSVGIADRPLGDIPGVLRKDGSPPLYYLLLHFWLELAGRSEESVRGLSLLFALLLVPVAFWAGWLLFGRRTAWIAAALAALNPFITQYAQEARMYTLVALLGTVSIALWLQAFTRVAEPAGNVRRRAALGFSVALAAMLYTHNWALFFGAATGIAWLLVVWRAGGTERSRLLRTGLLSYGVIVALYLPWLPQTIYQAVHTGAPWSATPTVATLLSAPAKLLGETAELALLLVGGAGLASLLRRGGSAKARDMPVAGRAVLALISIAGSTILIAWISSQISPAWANRYMAAGLAPLLMLSAIGLAHAGRLGLVAFAVVAALWVIDGVPDEKSNVRTVAESIAPSLGSGDLIVTTQPEQIPVVDYYLPDGPGFATLTGPVSDAGVTDWVDGVRRLEETSAQQDLEPLLDTVESGRRLVLLVPQFYDLHHWQAPWTKLVRLRTQEWLQYMSNDTRFELTAVEPGERTSEGLPHPSPVQARVYLRR